MVGNFAIAGDALAAAVLGNLLVLPADAGPDPIAVGVDGLTVRAEADARLDLAATQAQLTGVTLDALDARNLRGGDAALRFDSFDALLRSGLAGGGGRGDDRRRGAGAQGRRDGRAGGRDRTPRAGLARTWLGTGTGTNRAALQADAARALAACGGASADAFLWLKGSPTAPCPPPGTRRCSHGSYEITFAEAQVGLAQNRAIDVLRQDALGAGVNGTAAGNLAARGVARTGSTGGTATRHGARGRRWPGLPTGRR